MLFATEFESLHPEKRAFPLRSSADSWSYFKLWIVNLFLIVCTLGLYYPWAKARKIKFFHENTWLHDSHFVSTINPRAMFKGFLVTNLTLLTIGLALFFIPANTTLSQFRIQLLGIFICFLVFPWFYRRGLMYRLYNTSYRGVRFSSSVSLKDCYSTFGYWAATYLIFFFYPFSFARFRELQIKYTRFGSTPFTMETNMGALYKIFFKAIGIVICAFLISMFFLFTLTPFFMFAGSLVVLVGVLLAMCYWRAHANNLVLSTVSVGSHLYLQSKLNTKKLLNIYLSNILFIVLSVGLYIPFASVRLTKYRASCLVVWCPSPDFLKIFAGAEFNQSSAIGESLVDDFSFDFSG